MNLDDLRKKARGGDLEPEPDKPCDFEGCENFATYKDEEGRWCHTHRVKMIRETVTRGVSSFVGSAATAIGFTGFTIATCAISPSVATPIPASTITKSKELEEKDEHKGLIYIGSPGKKKKDKKKSKVKNAAKNALAFAKGFAKGMIEDEPEGTKE